MGHEVKKVLFSGVNQLSWRCVMSRVKFKVKHLTAALAALALGGLAQVAVGGFSGGSGEGVVACPAGAPAYQPPPYQGTVILQAGYDGVGQPAFLVSTDGSVGQFGQSGCSLAVTNLVIPSGGVPLQDVKGNDLQGLCLSIDSGNFNPASCGLGGIVLEIMGVGSRKTVGNAVTFDVILMPRLGQ
ncbi:MAG: hypothetical protein A2809_03650 [Candidatus Muproteobacteria bacterium RIFCSPHIGHO2_01_FULL_61_200]|uniref:Uncharacterized protein n=1 Tax=Candidatus Muproteobacteria bacterium RIFCSPLOWO2_01_FULL_60_18 TaxID=1817768 RepID=A0A1F6U191_9PROT|nr:MAG: hypothetical protein A3A87_03230 [Candidatus Muproteobacteria bacterium RIFCSPLOWO2_01_FULL_60_18]OGI58035.1 MAG: hypothetical protein A2809_03650 [Candidatus Muproteobacteria bacterium RIFCSPHIGHO2_01_FULL_61_200]